MSSLLLSVLSNASTTLLLPIDRMYGPSLGPSGTPKRIVYSILKNRFGGTLFFLAMLKIEV